ncbi:MAG: TIGR01440 family protein [Clostridia bacterium]|nr:TIGR01440 family protein [Clostridia bacterium]
MSNVYEQSLKAINEIIEISGIKKGGLLVIGCSTSEVAGERIGTTGSPDIAEEIKNAAFDAAKEKGIEIAAQCCEHLNRALVIERELAKKLNYEPVCAVPHPHAGGSFATSVYHSMKGPVLVEKIEADAGIDIGNTLIGMHLKRVAVPVRLKNNEIGNAYVNAARTRPKYIGGERAKYE